MSKTIYLGYIGGARIWFDDDPNLPTLFVEATPQGTWLARLLSPDPLRPVLISRTDMLQGNRSLCVPYAPDVDRIIVELVEVLGGARYLVPGLVQLSLLDVPDATH